MGETSIEAKIPQVAKDYAKELTEYYHGLPGHSDTEALESARREFKLLREDNNEFRAFSTLKDAIAFAGESTVLDSVVELYDPEPGAAYAAIIDIPLALFSGCRLVVAYNHIYEAYEAITGKPSPIPGSGDDVDEIEEV